MIWAVSKLFLGLGIVFVLLFLLTKLLKRTNLGRTDFASDSGIRLLTTKPIAPQKYISLVEIGGEIFALGISEAQITLLTKIENKEFAQRLASDPSVHPDSLSWLKQITKGTRRLKNGSLRVSHGK